MSIKNVFDTEPTLPSSPLTGQQQDLFGFESNGSHSNKKIIYSTEGIVDYPVYKKMNLAILMSRWKLFLLIDVMAIFCMVPGV